MSIPMKSIFGLKSDGSQFPGKSPKEIADYLSQLGINAVFGGYENPTLRDELKKHNIKVYAEIGIFVGTKYWETHPESRPITDLGKPMEKEEWYGGLCPNQDWLQNEKLKDIQDLCTKYEVDGVWLDFIRYPCHWEVKNPKLVNTCFCNVCLTKFQRQTGIKIPGDLSSTSQKAGWILENHKKDWTQWKCNVILDFVMQAQKIVKNSKNDILLGLFGVPWNADDYHNSIHDIIAQDYVSLAPHVDVFTPMLYHKLCYRDISWISKTTGYLSNITKKQVVPIVQACSIPSKMGNQEFTKTLLEAEKLPSTGVIVFTLDYSMKEAKMNTLKTNFLGYKP